MKVKSLKNQFEMQGPVKQYPAPKFPEQTQPDYVTGETYEGTGGNPTP